MKKHKFQEVGKGVGQWRERERERKDSAVVCERNEIAFIEAGRECSRSELFNTARDVKETCQ